MMLKDAPWGDQQTLVANRERLREQLRQQLREFETRYEINSERVYEEIDAGRLRETVDVCSWLLKLDTWQALADGSSPQLA